MSHVWQCLCWSGSAALGQQRAPAPPRSLQIHHCCKAKGIRLTQRLSKGTDPPGSKRPLRSPSPTIKWTLSKPWQGSQRDLQDWLLHYGTGSAHTANTWHHSWVLGCWIQAPQASRGTSSLLIFARREKMRTAFSALRGSHLSDLFISIHRIMCSEAAQQDLAGNLCVVCAS